MRGSVARWREVVSTFLQQERPYVELARADGRRVQRSLDEICIRRNLLINGGGQRAAMRSFGDATRKTRQSCCLTRGPGNTEDPLTILQGVNAHLENNMIVPCVGWESICSLPDDYMAILSCDHHYLYPALFLRLLEQMVVRSTVRASSLRRQVHLPSTSKPCWRLYNASHRGSVVRHILRPMDACCATSRKYGRNSASGHARGVSRRRCWQTFAATWTGGGSSQ